MSDFWFVDDWIENIYVSIDFVFVASSMETTQQKQHKMNGRLTLNYVKYAESHIYHNSNNTKWIVDWL